MTTTTRRDFVKAMTGGTIAWGLSAQLRAAAKQPKEPKRPNVLWIVAEDMNDLMGCYGHKLVGTPTFDALAKRGVRFARAYVPAPVCSACRSAIITGTMQTTLGLHNHRSSRSNTRHPEHSGLGLIHLPKGVKTIPELFRAAGYHTFNRGKTDYNFVYRNGDLYSGKGWRDAGGKPWFGQIQLKGGKGKPTRKIATPDKVPVPPYYPDCDVFRAMIAKHYNNVHETDLDVRKILDSLEADGLLDNTIVIFFSDHGMPGGLRHKQFCYEGGLRVPLLIRWPESAKDAPRGGVRDDLVSLIDVAVTSLAMAGIAVPDHMEGRDLFAKNFTPRQYVIGARDRCDYTIEHIRAVVTRRYKYLRNFLTDRPYLQPQYRDGRPEMITWKRLRKEGKLMPAAAVFVGDARPAEELYDLQADPHEIRNLAGEAKHKAELDRHRKILQTWMKATDDKGQYPESAEGLLQVLYRWRGKCVNPEYKAVRKKYPQMAPPGAKKPRTRKKRGRQKKTQ